MLFYIRDPPFQGLVNVLHMKTGDPSSNKLISLRSFDEKKPPQESCLRASWGQHCERSQTGTGRVGALGFMRA